MAAPFNYGPIRKTALGLIKQYGRPCALLRGTDPTATDVTKPWRVEDPTVVAYPFSGVYSAIRFPRLSEPNVDPGEMDIIMPGDVNTDSDGNVGATIEPLITDRLKIFGIIEGETDPIYAIVGVHRIDPAGAPIMYTLRCVSQPGITRMGASGL